MNCILRVLNNNLLGGIFSSYCRLMITMLVIGSGLFLRPQSSQAVGVADSIDAIRSLPVQQGGRIKPLDTFARESLLNIAGDLKWKDQDPLYTILSMKFEGEKWANEPILFVSWMPLRERLGMGTREHYISLEKLLSHPEFQKVMSDLQETRDEGEEFDSEQTEYARTYHRAMTLRSVMDGSDWKMLPRPKGPSSETWRSPFTDLVGDEDPQIDVQKAFKSLEVAFLAQDGTTSAVAAAEVASHVTPLMEIPENGVDTPIWKLNLEVRYNQIQPFSAAGNMALAGFLLFSLGLFATSTEKWTLNVGSVCLLGVFLLTTFGLGTRVVLSQRGPISNIYETMIYIGWGSCLFGLILGAIYGMRLWGMGATLTAAIMLFIAEHSYTSFDPFITPLVPVLRSNWLWFHVQVIILGYAGLFLTITLSHLRLAFSFFLPGRPELTRSMDPFVHRAMQVGSASLGIGIILGGIWADYSWGRYWGWDPKETWSLITLLCYLAVLHARFAGSIGGFGTSVGGVLGVFPLLMCYYGVNFLLVGLHSYAGSDANAGASFFQKLLTVPMGLKMFVLFETVFLGMAWSHKNLRGKSKKADSEQEEI